MRPSRQLAVAAMAAVAAVALFKGASFGPDARAITDGLKAAEA